MDKWAPDPNKHESDYEADVSHSKSMRLSTNLLALEDAEKQKQSAGEGDKSHSPNKTPVVGSVKALTSGAEKTLAEP
jgi:hypothetical protein